MTWSDLRQLDPAWITIGSDTVSNPILPALDRQEFCDEVGESRRWLESTLGRDVELSRYPNGGQDPFALPRIGIRMDLPQLDWELQTT